MIIVLTWRAHKLEDRTSVSYLYIRVRRIFTMI